jgi:predicted RNase H-like nuclease (RuvC/YqgF family)
MKEQARKIVLEIINSSNEFGGEPYLEHFTLKILSILEQRVKDLESENKRLLEEIEALKVEKEDYLEAYDLINQVAKDRLNKILEIQHKD